MFTTVYKVLIFWTLQACRRGLWKVKSIDGHMRGIRWQVKQIMSQGSCGITLGINVNGKPHDLAVASERLHFKSNWHGPCLEVASEAVMQAPDTHACKSACFSPHSPTTPLQGIPEVLGTEVSSTHRNEQQRDRAECGTAISTTVAGIHMTYAKCHAIPTLSRVEKPYLCYFTIPIKVCCRT